MVRRAGHRVVRGISGLALALAVERLVAERIRRARRITLADVDARPMPVKLRDGLARLLSPYL